MTFGAGKSLMMVWGQAGKVTPEEQKEKPRGCFQFGACQELGDLHSSAPAHPSEQAEMGSGHQFWVDLGFLGWGVTWGSCCLSHLLFMQW